MLRAEGIEDYNGSLSGEVLLGIPMLAFGIDVETQQYGIVTVLRDRIDRILKHCGNLTTINNSIIAYLSNKSSFDLNGDTCKFVVFDSYGDNLGSLCVDVCAFEDKVIGLSIIDSNTDETKMTILESCWHDLSKIEPGKWLIGTIYSYIMACDFGVLDAIGERLTELVACEKENLAIDLIEKQFVYDRNMNNFTVKHRKSIMYHAYDF